MHRIYFSFTVLLTLLLSCSNDSETLPKGNGFEHNGIFYELNNAYFAHDRTTSQDDDFFMYFTDGEIISINEDTNEIVFTENSSVLISFRAIQNPNTANALNFAPSGPYQFNSSNELLENISFKFNCQSIQGSFTSCETEIEITSMDSNSSGAIMEIIRDSSLGATYNFTFELIDGQIINGQFIGERSYPIE